MRFYGFDITEILNQNHPNLDVDVDPKLGWALRNLDYFPVDVNKADKWLLARVPGIGIKSVNKIISARRFRKLNWEHLHKIGIALNRARYFLISDSSDFERRDLTSDQIKSRIQQNSSSKYQSYYNQQLQLF